MNIRTVAAGLVAAGLTLTACAPGSPAPGSDTQAAPPSSRTVSTDPASMGNVELTVWDQEVRGGGNAQLTQLIGDFQKKYPNIEIKRVSRSFDDLTKTLRLALSGNDAPDVVQANNTRSQMGQFVKAGQLLPLDPWMQAYGWDKRYGQSIRAASSYSSDGKTFGSGSLYGLPQVGEVVGIYVNKDKLRQLGIDQPTTWAEFESSLATAKSKGEVPIQFGNLDKWPAVHVFGVLQGQYEPADQVRKLGFGQPGASWTDAGNKQAAQKMVEWVDKGYFASGFNGQGYDPAWQAFSKGQGVYLIAGTWLQADLNKAMGDKVGFMLPPPAQTGGASYTTGGTGLPFAITNKAEKPDAAAAFINYITSPEAMQVIAKTENLPVVEAGQQQAPTPLAKDVFTAFDTTGKKDALLPYLDWSTPTMSDTIGASLQDLLAKKASPDQTLQRLQTDYSDFTAKG